MNTYPKQAEIPAFREAISGFSALVQGKLMDWCSFRGKHCCNYKLTTISLNKEPNKNTLLIFFLLFFFLQNNQPFLTASIEPTPSWVHPCRKTVFPGPLNQGGPCDLIWSMKCEWKYDMGHSWSEALRAIAWISRLFFPLSWEQHVSDWSWSFSLGLSVKGPGSELQPTWIMNAHLCLWKLWRFVNCL